MLGDIDGVCMIELGLLYVRCVANVWRSVVSARSVRKIASLRDCQIATI